MATRKKTGRKKASKKVTSKKAARRRIADRSTRPPSTVARHTPTAVARLFQAYFDGVLLPGGSLRDACCARLARISIDPTRIGDDFANILVEHFPSASPEQFDALRLFDPGGLDLFRRSLGLFLRCPLDPDPHGPRPPPDPPYFDGVPYRVTFAARDHRGPDTLQVSVASDRTGSITFLRSTGRR